MSSEGTPLDDDIPGSILLYTELLDGYSIIKQLEATERDKPATQERKERLMYIRILAYLILEGPSFQARAAVARLISQCPNVGAIMEEGKKFFNFYIRAFYKFRGPASSSHSIHSSRSFENLQDMMKQLVVQTPQNSSQAKRNALLRDGLYCRVSGTYDRKIKEIQGWKDIVGSDYEVLNTECAHIIPESTDAGITGKPAKLEQAANLWAILSIFGYTDMFDELNGTKIHRLENVFTLEHNVHDEFDRLDLWFEATDVPYTYNVCGAYDDTIRRRWNNRIQFTTTRTDLPPPSPTYLAIHAACCRVAHLSGAAGYMDQFDRELESVSVLSKDGTSADLLAYSLEPFSQRISVY